ncbi:hypothetical protein AV530_012814 [Patagioenas fasciata monilis]|uniref:Uncharacterized protein n=1 Tax=Patagioenas fasciata monilis TaxID=372326 RepID=A0A1V4J9J2_PATFA|nr:hypothetical protein AV530_012814 [Patagioenas fasciata monilis]
MPPPAFAPQAETQNYRDGRSSTERNLRDLTPKFGHAPSCHFHAAPRRRQRPHRQAWAPRLCAAFPRPDESSPEQGAGGPASGGRMW